ncbi:MAG: hypothetical protein IKQ46_02925 [Bacteroidales bacterium]|nr:hypothetical protein [Bacteroidales bacterium]
MKKITYILSMALMLSSAFFQVACDGLLHDDEDSTTVDPNGGGEVVYDGAVQSFSVQLSYNSDKLSNPASLNANTLTAVALNNSSEADLTLVRQSTLGYVIASPNAPYVKDLLRYNHSSFNNSGYRTTKVMKLNGDVSNYSDVSSLKNLTVSSGSIENVAGKNQVVVNSGDVIAFETQSGVKGVAKVSGLSKITGKVTLTGYVYYASSAK